MSGQAALFKGAIPERVLIFDEPTGILYLQLEEANICPYCRATEHQAWECGEADFYEMTCRQCRQGYGVSLLEAEA